MGRGAAGAMGVDVVWERKRTAAQNWQSRGIDVEIERMGAVQVQQVAVSAAKTTPSVLAQPWAMSLGPAP